ncbi:GSCFA domain-containing protein [Lunatibacter salilacus]|uniref:GSCFA domain-containing protein n=1 Tax=Lunatibacter salilacus TaxID=2483804 RepID=UPI00131B1EF9|nr:GSCFA domain-containing protein [Lunatibacter salilacus]
MEFRTNFSIQPQQDKVTYDHPVITMGSCFSSLLGQRMGLGKMNVLGNPFGVIFNPVTVCQLITHSLLKTSLPDEGFLASNGYHYHYLTHSTLYGRTFEELNHRLHIIQREVADTISKASHVFFTWGSSYVYEKKAEGLIVANCHKQPGRQFEKRLSNLSEMQSAFSKCYEAMIRVQPNIQLVLTVSPVRHIKDGIPENQLSKSLLRILCHELAETHGQVSYFPSYEWMIDDLRDYRFYKSDLIHPSEVAEEYIWQEFQKVYFDQNTLSLWGRIKRIQTSLAHKPFHPESMSHQTFLRNLLYEMEELSPQVDFCSEIEGVKRQLESI